MYLHPPDPELAARVADVVGDWGGNFEVVGAPEWKTVVRAANGPVVHLTMYGRPLDEALPRLAGAREILVVVGGAKVPSDLYRLSDVNVAVGHQPHSEVAALAVVLDRLLGVPGPGRWERARLSVVPRARGKKVAVAKGAP
jgi:tRNA (cytidine56-2'-O)-methyltransferase